VYLPSWLPESVMLYNGKDKFFVEYTIRAQFTPTSNNDFAKDPYFPLKGN